MTFYTQGNGGKVCWWSKMLFSCGEILIKIQRSHGKFDAGKVIYDVERVRYEYHLENIFTVRCIYVCFVLCRNVNGRVLLPAVLSLFFFTPCTLMDTAAFLLLNAFYILIPYVLILRKLYFSTLFKFLRLFFCYIHCGYFDVTNLYSFCEN